VIGVDDVINVIDSFSTFLELKGYSSETIKQYCYDIKLFFTSYWEKALGN